MGDWTNYALVGLGWVVGFAMGWWGVRFSRQPGDSVN
jgi:hypothetical protein